MKTGRNKTRNKKSRKEQTTAPKMPKDNSASPKIEGRAFRPGQGGSWSAKVGQRDVRKITKGGAEKLRTRSDNYNSGLGLGLKVEKQKLQGRAADTRGIKNIGK